MCVKAHIIILWIALNSLCNFSCQSPATKTNNLFSPTYHPWLMKEIKLKHINFGQVPWNAITHILLKLSWAPKLFPYCLHYLCFTRHRFMSKPSVVSSLIVSYSPFYLTHLFVFVPSKLQIDPTPMLDSIKWKQLT